MKLRDLESMSERLAENRSFLQSYMLDPNEDNRPAEEERIKEILSIAGEMEEILTDLIEAENAAIASADEDVNIEYKTHTLGCPDGERNIEGDWTIGEEEVLPLEDFPEEILPVKVKKAKKHKKGKKEKKGKKKK